MKNNKKQTNKRRADQKRNKVAALQAAWLTTITRIVVVQFYPWFNFYFPLFLGMVIYDNEFETKENKN